MSTTPNTSAAPPPAVITPASDTYTVDARTHADLIAYIERRKAFYATKNRQYRYSDLATELGVSVSYVSRYIDGKPNFDPTKLEKSARSILTHEARRATIVHGLFPTAQSKALANAAEDLKATCSVGLIYGESGSGKTAAVEIYAQNNPSTIYIALHRWEKTGSEVARLLCEFLDPEGRNRGTTQRPVWLVRQLRDSGRLIIVDNADEASYDALKWLFDFADATNVPILLVGNEDVLKIIRRNPKMFSRLGLFEALNIPEGRALRTQVATLLAALAPEQADAILDLAVEVAERSHGGHLRAVVKRVIQMQTIIATGKAAGKADLSDPVAAFKLSDRRLPEPGIERPERRTK